MSEGNTNAGAVAALDPDQQAVVDGTEQILGAPLNEMPIDEARRRMQELYALVPPGPKMHAVQDVTAPGPNGDVPLRIYVPSADQGLPVLLWIHGGAFAFGEPDFFDSSCSELADRASAVVVSVDYRLAPEHPFPAGVEDSYAALVWVAERIAEFGGDPERIAIGGDSAGGGIAAAVTLMARDRSGPGLVYQLLAYPALADVVSNDEFSEVQVINRPVYEHFWDLYAAAPEDRENPYCVPIKAADLSGLPPAFVVVPEVDAMRDSQVRYADRLSQAGVPTRCEVYPGTAHGFLLATGAISRADLAMGEVIGDLRAAFDQAAAKAS
ncbi:MAG: alpha/beta hydrolase [Actinobacteria bacterium]|nr:alpha/beta hydrolase [Actinomycetota bacterium]